MDAKPAVELQKNRFWECCSHRNQDNSCIGIFKLCQWAQYQGKGRDGKRKENVFRRKGFR